MASTISQDEKIHCWSWHVREQVQDKMIARTTEVCPAVLPGEFPARICRDRKRPLLAGVFKYHTAACYTRSRIISLCLKVRSTSHLLSDFFFILFFLKKKPGPYRVGSTRAAVVSSVLSSSAHRCGVWDQPARCTAWGKRGPGLSLQGLLYPPGLDELCQANPVGGGARAHPGPEPGVDQSKDGPGLGP